MYHFVYKALYFAARQNKFASKFSFFYIVLPVVFKDGSAETNPFFLSNSEYVSTQSRRFSVPQFNLIHWVKLKECTACYHSLILVQQRYRRLETVTERLRKDQWKFSSSARG